MGTTAPADLPPSSRFGGGTEPPLVDRQQRLIEYVRVSVTDRCDLRCTYCIPEHGVDHVAREDVLSFEELTRLAGCFARLGVRRLRLTGGEPTVRRELPRLAAMLRAVDGIEDLALSTNGHRLTELAEPLRRAGVDRLNVSVDSLEPARFASITRGGDLGRVQAGLEAARLAGFSDIKLNTVAVRGFNDDELAALCSYAWERGFVPRFIEQMPMADGALFVPGTFMGAREIRDAIAAGHPGARLIAEPARRAAGAGPARYWRVEGDSGTLGRFGVISPLTEHFCDSCNRVRLSASGALHTCLGYDDATDLRRVLHEGGEAAVVEAIRAAVTGKRDGHTFGLLGIGGPRKAMVQIGG